MRKPRYWAIRANEEDTPRWDAMRRGGFASIGWKNLGNLRVLLRGLAEEREIRERLKDALEQHYGECRDNPGGDAGQIWRFLDEIHVGDRVIAVDKNGLLGVGIVKGDYQFVASDTLQPHHRVVDWLDLKGHQFRGRMDWRTVVFDFTEKRPDHVKFVNKVVATSPHPDSGVNVCDTDENTLLDAIAAEIEELPFDPNATEDLRVLVDAARVRRDGAEDFRQQLLAAYEGRCAITGCDVADVLDACHITPYMGRQSNVHSNGLLLRTDVHRLFDRGLITVDPKSHRILVSPLLRDSGYWELAGCKLFEPQSRTQRPSVDALRYHREKTGL